jgi:uncharacterized membrane protein YfcA
VAALAIAVGLLIGLSLGALGGGGSILAVPALVYLLGQSPHQATTASLLVVAMAAVAGAITHAWAGRVRLKEGAAFGLLGIVGSWAGSRASTVVPASVLLAGFGALMLVLAAAMFARGRLQAWAHGSARAPAHGSAGAPVTSPARAAGPGRQNAAGAGRLRGGRHPLLVAGAATGVGLITGFFGIGGGFVVVPALVLVLGFDMPAAAGTSLVVIAINSTAALAARASHGGPALNWALTGAFGAAALAGALAGGRLAGRASPRWLSGAFTVLIVAVGGYTLARSVPVLA